ncbi:MAG: NAD(+)/NADH kinase [Actinomycetota bacterium]
MIEHLRVIGVVAHPTMPTASAAQARLAEIAARRDIALVSPPGNQNAGNQNAGTKDAGDKNPDLVIALGGDGTILRAAQVAVSFGVPLIGANLGKLGFLSTGDAEHLEPMIDALIAGRYRIERRMMLEARASQPGEKFEPVAALNEVVLERGTLSRVVSINVSVGGEAVATYIADGFIVSTPTGSTAYSLSAGGPVVEPEVQAMILTSVSAHTPLWRSIVVGPNRTVTLECPDDRVAFSADGQAVEILEAGNRLDITPHASSLLLVTFDDIGFYDKLRSRFRIEPGFHPTPAASPAEGSV